MLAFNYQEDIPAITICVVIFIFDLGFYLFVEDITYLLGWSLLSIAPKILMSSWNHHHQHLHVFRYRILNRLIELLYGLQTGICGYMWVLHHNYGHHLNYLDQAHDQSRWQDKNGKPYGRFSYIFVTCVTSIFRCLQVGKRFPNIRNNFLAMLALTFFVLFTLTYIKPLHATLIFIIPLIISFIQTINTTYMHHFGLSTSAPEHASRNIVDSKWFNRLTGNLGYHTAHHLKFGLHWSKLPHIHEKIKHKIPPNCYYKPILIFRLLDHIDKRIRNYRPRKIKSFTAMANYPRSNGQI